MAAEDQLSPSDERGNAAGLAVDPRRFRDVLGSFTTGVTIVTATNGEGILAGVTANSFTSVSLDPPLVLWSLARSSQSLKVFETCDHWAVHILSHEQDALSGRFARRGDNKFDGLDYEGGIGGTPLLKGCTARLQCRVRNRYDGGDHVILVGEVLSLEHNDTPPLVYQSGSYAIATRKESADIPLPRTAGAARNREIESSIGYLLASAYLQFYARIRAYATSRGLNEAELFVLSALAARDGRSIEEFNALFAFAGQVSNQEVFNDLCARNLIRFEETVEQNGQMLDAQLFLTPEGRLSAQDIVSASGRMESETMERLGITETIALRMLLQKFVRTTDMGQRYRWL
jgi:3-hydroxy-9,10-secoandrosta-1,3,5(10)-triene-9,17-dione monooxygenase reductase component